MKEMFITPMNLTGNSLGKSKIMSNQTENIGFSDIFKQAIENVKQSDADLARKEYLLSVGKVNDAHTVPAAAAKAQLSVDFLTALRNKTLEAYNEVIRLNI